MPWSYDSDYDYCPHCEDYGQDCGQHGEIFDDAVEVLESLSMLREPFTAHPIIVDTAWIKTRIPKPEYL